jgi:hypothetical protein
MKVIQELVAYFERRGKLRPAQMDRLLRKGFLATEPPASLVPLCANVGESYYFRVRGDDVGPVWGTDIYTGDSVLSVAAVHAGAVTVGESKVVKVTVVAPLQQYHGSTRNGISSHSFGPFGTAYQVEAFGADSASPA